MLKFINISAFTQHLFDNPKQVNQAAMILKAILATRSPRISDICEHMPGNAESNYKMVQRFIAKADMQTVLLRLFQEEAEFVIGDPTEVQRPEARKTDYVGTLSNARLWVSGCCCSRPHSEGEPSPSISSPILHAPSTNG